VKLSRNNNFIHDLTKKIVLNNPYLITKGDAGNGRSHLLSDITKKPELTFTFIRDEI
jgi:hypothetical protein